MSESRDRIAEATSESRNQGQRKQSRLIDEIKALEEQLISLKRDLIQDRTRAAGIENQNATLPLALFSVANRLIGLPLSHVEQVELMPAIAEVIEQREAVIGMVNYHGEHLSVIDLGVTAGLRRSEVSPDRVLIICNQPYRFALVVDEAVDVITIRERDLLFSEDILIDRSLTVGYVRWRDKPVAVVDLLLLATRAREIGAGTISTEQEHSGE
jgi:chemotaxis signal transduction protein